MSHHCKMAELLPSLLRHGFVKVPASPEALATLRHALGTWSASKTFRHPPVPPDAGNGATFPCAFNALFDVCRTSLHLLDLEWQQLEGRPLGAPMHEMPGGNVFLPGQSKPFVGGVPPSAFDASFFNLFNYDYGSLNSHVDRGLITVVYGFSGTPLNGHDARVSEETASVDNQQPRSRLWLRDAAASDLSAPGAWVDAEVECGTDGVILFAGEQLEALTGRRVPAIEHCVRVRHKSPPPHTLTHTRLAVCKCHLLTPVHAHLQVDPVGPYLNRSHQYRDPRASERGNRLSAAMICSYVER